MEPAKGSVTHIVAKASGDQPFLYWLYARMTLVYGENENMDYVQTLSRFCAYFDRRARVPAWLNWLLRKYDL